MIYLLSPGALLITSLFTFLTLPSFKTDQQKTFSLTVETSPLKNNNGTVVFALYNREESIPDEHYKKYYKRLIGKIDNNRASVAFKDLPAGKYAVNVLHDEDNNGKIKKGFVLPKEGIGFSNFQTIGLGNKPNFKKASFTLNSDLEILVKVIYF